VAVTNSRNKLLKKIPRLKINKKSNLFSIFLFNNKKRKKKKKNLGVAESSSISNPLEQLSSSSILHHDSKMSWRQHHLQKK
jgi:hypothetical protein